MVLVTLSTTVCLYVGMEDLLKIQYPREIEIEAYLSNGEKDKIQDLKFEDMIEINEALNNTVGEVLKEHSLEAQNFRNYFYLSFSAAQDKSYFNTDDSMQSIYAANSVRSLYFLPLADYNKNFNKNETLSANEILIYYTHGNYPYETFNIFNKSYIVKEQFSDEKKRYI